MKEKLRNRINGALAEDVRPGEELETGAYGLFLPFPWTLGFLLEGWLVLLIATPYYLGLTDQRLIFRKVSRLSTKRSTFEKDYPRASVSVQRFRKGAFWTTMVLQLPERKRRLRFQRPSRDEAEQIARGLGWSK